MYLLVFGKWICHSGSGRSFWGPSDESDWRLLFLLRATLRTMNLIKHWLPMGFGGLLGVYVVRISSFRRFGAVGNAL